MTKSSLVGGVGRRIPHRDVELVWMALPISITIIRGKDDEVCGWELFVERRRKLLDGA